MRGDNSSRDNSGRDTFRRDNSSRDNFWENNSSSGPTLLKKADREYFWFTIFESTPNPPQISPSPADLPIQNLKLPSKYLLPTKEPQNQNTEDPSHENPIPPNNIIPSTCKPPPNPMLMPTIHKIALPTPNISRSIQPCKLTYSRRKVTKTIVEQETLHDQEASLESKTKKDLFELDVPIAMKKGTRACTQHPISKFLGYGHLS